MDLAQNQLVSENSALTAALRAHHLDWVVMVASCSAMVRLCRACGIDKTRLSCIACAATTALCATKSYDLLFRQGRVDAAKSAVIRAQSVLIRAENTLYGTNLAYSAAVQVWSDCVTRVATCVAKNIGTPAGCPCK